MQVSPLTRVFEFNSLRIPDPDSKLSAEEVRAVLANVYPDIATATLTGPEAVGDKLVYRLQLAVGTKG